MANAFLEALPRKTLESCVQSLMDHYICCVCLEVVRPELVQCVNEHLLCRECKGDLQKCPTCNQLFSEAKPSRHLIKVIETLPKTCKHNNCYELLDPNDDHEKFCGFRETTCKKCLWVGPGKDIIGHIKEEHADEKIFSAANNYSTLRDFNTDLSFVGFTPFVVNNYFIWLKWKFDAANKKYFKQCYLVPNGKPKDNIYFKLVFSSKHSKFMSRIKLNPDPDLDTLEENTIDVPWRSLPNYIDSDTKLRFSVYFSTEGM